MRAAPLLLASALLFWGSSPVFASCPGGFCPVQAMPIPGLKPVSNPQTGFGSQGGVAPFPSGLSRVQPLVREPHPFVRAPLLPQAESLEPATALAFQLADLQVERLIGASDTHLRPSEFHNTVDYAGNTFNANSRGFSFSAPLIAISLFALLLASALALSFFIRTRPQPSPALPSDPHPLSPAPQEPAFAPLPAIEWEEQAVHPPKEASWADLLQVCTGDVMRAAAFIQAEAAADPVLDPSSPEAFRRAIVAAHSQAVPAT